MNLQQYAVLDECYRGLRANGWPKEEAGEAARRHLSGMTRRQFREALIAAMAAQKYRDTLKLTMAV